MNKWQRWKNIMKAVPFEEKRLARWRPPFIVQPKYDGVRCRAVPIDDGKQFLLLSSEENVIFSVPHINETLPKLNLNVELDGELYCHGKEFSEILSITSRTVNIHPNAESIKFHVFDIVNEAAQVGRTLEIESLRNKTPFIDVAPFWLCESLNEVMATYEIILSEGYEGIIVRHPDAPYVRKRSTFIMKFKPKQSDTYRIIGFEEEHTIDGIPKGRLGSLICDSGDGNTFNVYSGFDDKERAGLWEMRTLLPGNSVKILYQHIIPKSNKPRFPVFGDILWET